VAGRPLNFVYFGGGTPSFLSTSHHEGLVRRQTAVTPWDDAEEITFECEPGTLTAPKLATIRALGVTRLSLGIENFSDRLLELNGRAHRAPEVFRAYEQARAQGFPQINIDLIAGMLGETEDNWQSCIEQTIALAPDSVTIYQMELPFNTTISGDRLRGAGRFAESVASWSTKRRWVGDAFAALETAGYHQRSAYTFVRNPGTRFVYTDRVWSGGDLAALGVASFGRMSGVHMQNVDTWEAYSSAIGRGALPLSRAYRPTADERLVRDFILQLKRGAVAPASFRRSHGVNLLDRFRAPLESLAADGYLAEAHEDRVALTREGLLRVDVLLKRFFLPAHADLRYT
jgi:oxygen-independent coproporphyrinogen-3 oxidase